MCVKIVSITIWRNMEPTPSNGAGKANQTYYRVAGALSAATFCALGALALRRLPSGNPLFKGVEVRHLVATGLGATGLALGAHLWRKGRTDDDLDLQAARVAELTDALEPAATQMKQGGQQMTLALVAVQALAEGADGERFEELAADAGKVGNGSRATANIQASLHQLGAHLNSQEPGERV
jgi:hypothetical protein